MYTALRRNLAPYVSYPLIQNGELRRTLGDRQADSGAVVHSLKQKILKLEMQMREKESAYW